MASRFLFQKLVSRMSRSTSLLGAQVSAPVTRRASEGGITTLSNLSHGAAAHLTTVVSNNPGIHVYEGAIRTLSNIYRGASVRPGIPVPNIRGINGSPARYLSTLHCTRAITDGMKPALVDYVRAKRIFSSNPSAKHCEHKLSALEAEREAKWEAVRAAHKADLEAWNAKKDAEDAAFSRSIAIIGSAWCLIFLCWISMLGSGSSHSENCEGQSNLKCCKCQTCCSESHC